MQTGYKLDFLILTEIQFYKKTNRTFSFFLRKLISNFDFPKLVGNAFVPKVQFVSSLHANWTISRLKVQKLSSLHANWIQTGLLIRTEIKFCNKTNRTFSFILAKVDLKFRFFQACGKCNFSQIVKFLSSLHANWTISRLKVQKLSSLHANWIQTVLL